MTVDLTFEKPPTFEKFSPATASTVLRSHEQIAERRSLVDILKSHGL